MNLLETANNAFLAIIAAPEAIRELRAYGAEEMDREGICQAMLRYRARVDELEIDIRKLREFNHGLALEGDKLKARIAELEHNLEAAESSSANLTELVERLESELTTLRAKAEPSIPEPDPGEGWELCERNQATEYRCAHWEQSKPWKQMDMWWQASPVLTYRFRRPIAKPEPKCPTCESPSPHLHPSTQADGGEYWLCNDGFHKTVTPENTPEKIASTFRATPEPQWVACTAEEARANPEVSEWHNEAAATWYPCKGSSNGSRIYPYRTTAAMSEWVEFDYNAWRQREDLPQIFNDGAKWRMRRSEIKVGTVLG